MSLWVGARAAVSFALAGCSASLPGGHRCAGDRELVDNVCVSRQVADFIICIRSRGSVELRDDKRAGLVLEARVAGQQAQTAVEAKAVLDAKYGTQAGAEGERQVIDRCAAVVGLTTLPGAASTNTRSATTATDAPGASSVDIASPPYFNRVYFGWVPYEKNSLVSWLFLSSWPRETAIELWVDASPVAIVINRGVSAGVVQRGDHAGKKVSLIPKGTPPYGSLQLDAPGKHGVEIWCYEDLPGVGLVQVGHKLGNIYPERNESIGCD